MNMTSRTSSISIEPHGVVVRVIINRPPLNVLDIATLREFNSCFAHAAAGAETRLVEIRAAGQGAFSAGTDVRDHFPERAAEMLREFHALIRAILYAPVPTVAVVRGHCLGGGLELALACDFILASTDGRFGLPEIKLGAFPPVGAALLPLLIGERQALEMILSGGAITAEEAQRLGLVNHAWAPAHFEEEAEKFERLLLAHSPCVVALARKAARLSSREVWETRLRECERIYLEQLLPTGDATEGLKAFLEKRAPIWRNK
jgi:cyclohexa-1,5-dienecarbonyl-CoA hydratase